MPVTVAIGDPASGTTEWYLSYSKDGTSWRWFAGPVVESNGLYILTEQASEAAAQANAIAQSYLGNTTNSRVDLPTRLIARYTRIHHRNTVASYAMTEFFPRRLVEADDIRGESIVGYHIAAGTITGDLISGTAINGFTITGATIQTAASGERVVLDSTGLKTYDSAGVVQVEATTATDGKLTAGAGNVTLDASGLSVTASTSATPNVLNSVNWEQGGEDVGQIFGYNSTGSHFLRLAAPATATKYGHIQLAAEVEGGGDEAGINIIGGDGAAPPSTISLGAEVISVSGAFTVTKQIRPGGVGALAYNSAAISLSNNTTTTITLNSERFDTDSYHSTSSNTSRLTVPTGMGGIYQITAQGRFASNSTGFRQVAIRLNGTTIIGNQAVPAISGAETEMAVSTCYNLAAGDYVELLAYQNSGGNLDLMAAAWSPVLAMTKQ